MSKNRKSIAYFTLLVLLSLSACSFSTAADVTPPPSLPTATRAAASPTQVPLALEASPAAGETPITEQSDAGSAQPIRLSGRVTNLSGGEVPASLEVVLQGFTGMEIVFTQSELLAEDGSFAFDVEPVEGQVYILTVEYEGVVFGSDVIHAADLAPGEMSSIEISIYDKNSDTSELYADRAHIFFTYLSAEQLQVVVYLLVSNPTDFVIAGQSPEAPVLSFTLPADAANLQFEDSGMTARFIPVEGGFGDLLNIRPGLQQHEILFAYEVPYDGQRPLEMSFPIEVLSGTIVIPDGMQLSGDNLEDAGQRQMETGLVHLYTLSELSLGQTLQLQISGEASEASAASAASETGDASAVTENRTGLAIGLGFFALVLLLAGLWLRRKPKEQASVIAVQAEVAPGETLDALLDAIVALDTAYEAGEIDQEQYADRRAKLKERIRALRDKEIVNP